PYPANNYSWGNTDEVPSTTENVETVAPPWTPFGPADDGQWTIVASAPNDHRFLGPDVGAISDHALVSPPLEVAASGNFTFSFTHNFDFERDASNFYDGGVVEISNNGGGSWTDIGFALTPGYTSTLFSGSGNPLGGRGAYCGRTASYPALSTVNANLGATYQGQTLLVRFRVGTDLAVPPPACQTSP